MSQQDKATRAYLYARVAREPDSPEAEQEQREAAETVIARIGASPQGVDIWRHCPRCAVMGFDDLLPCLCKTYCRCYPGCAARDTARTTAPAREGQES